MKINFSSEQKKLLETLLFLVKVLLFAIPLYFILIFQNVLYPLQEAVSQNIYLILNFIGLETFKDGFLLKTNGFAFLISEDCTGWKSILFFAALIFAVPKVNIRKRVVGLAFGIPAIYVGNLFRILIMVFISLTFEYELAKLIHDYFWQIGLISLVLVVWIMWLLWTGKFGSKREITFLKRLHKLIKPR